MNRPHPFRTLTMLAAALVAGLLTVACGDGEKASDEAPPPIPTLADASPARLAILSPHNEFIKREFGRAFALWYAERHDGAEVEIDWQDRGGTGQLVQFIVGAYAALGDDADDGIGVDLVFGGGQPTMQRLKDNHCTARVDLPAEVLEAVPPDYAGVLLRDPEGHWFGCALSSFGIIYNKRSLADREIPKPRQWHDLANPAYHGRLVLADPAKSGSVRVCYEAILQKYGWEQGWAHLMHMCAHTTEFAATSSQVPRDVSEGRALAGLCIDFYAFNQIEEVGEETIGYVAPENATAITPDPICMLRGAPNREVAAQFIEFVLSPVGQRLWGLRAGVPGGPVEQALWRMPIRPDVYDEAGGQMRIPINPYASQAPFNLVQEMEAKRSKLLGPLFNAAFLNNKDLHERAWQVLADNPDRTDLQERFEAVPFTEERSLELAEIYVSNPRRAVDLDAEWQQAFRERYRFIIDSVQP